MTNPITTCTTSHSRDIPLISIHLPEDDNCPRPDSRGFCCCVVRTGGDLLEGEILLRASLDARLAVDVCFEGNPRFDIEFISAKQGSFRLGFCRTWIGNAYDNSRPCIREVRVRALWLCSVYNADTCSSFFSRSIASNPSRQKEM